MKQAKRRESDRMAGGVPSEERAERKPLGKVAVEQGPG